MDRNTSPITIEQLRVFVAAVDTGGFTAAGRALGRAQSAVSYGIANLEELLQVQLFDRSAHRPALSEAGKSLLGDARAILGQVDALVARAHSIGSGVEPSISFAVDMMFPQSLLRQILTSFEKQYPLVELHLYSEAMAESIDLVRRGECDIGISLLMEGLPNVLNGTVITQTEMIPVVSTKHALAAHEGAIPKSMLQGHTQIVLTNRKSLRSDVDYGVGSSRTWRVVDLRTKKDLIVDGFGFGSLPQHLIKDELAKGAVKRILTAPWQSDSFRLPLSLITSNERRLGPAGTWLCKQIELLCREAEDSLAS